MLVSAGRSTYTCRMISRLASKEEKHGPGVTTTGRDSSRGTSSSYELRHPITFQEEPKATLAAPLACVAAEMLLKWVLDPVQAYAADTIAVLLA
jgi:hypothetical protein